MKLSLANSIFVFLASASQPSLINAQVAEVCESEVTYKYDSGDTTAASTTVEYEGTPWIQLDLSETELDPKAKLVLTGVSSVETLTAETLANNGWSAVFEGGSVDVELVSHGSNLFRGNGKSSRVVVSKIKTGVCEAQPPASICGTTDDRIPSTDVRAGRIGGCTGWLISENVFLQAGHCGAPSASTRIHFTYGTGSASTSDQYAVDVDSYVSSDDFPAGTRLGHDFGIGRLLPNSVTGLLPGVAQSQKCGGGNCGWYDIGAMPGGTAGNTMRVTGYGTADVDSRSQKTHTGDLTGIYANAGSELYYLRYGMDTTGGNSGSPAIHEQTGTAIGIHTHGGCSETGGSNAGTRIDHPNLQPLIDFYLMSCSSDSDCSDSDVSNGLETCVNGQCRYGEAPTSAPTPCVGGSILEVELRTDNYPGETSYTLMDTCSQTQVDSMPRGSFQDGATTYTNIYCVAEGSSFDFTIDDSYSDGICCSHGSGSYEIRYEGQTRTSPTGGNFGGSETVQVGICSGPTTPRPTPNPTPEPTPLPTKAPVPTNPPTDAPTDEPTVPPPTNAPTTTHPTTPPTPQPTNIPTQQCLVQKEGPCTSSTFCCSGIGNCYGNGNWAGRCK